MDSRILSLRNICIVKSAIFVSLHPEVKKEILCVPGSEYDVCKLQYQYYRKEQWFAIVERKAKEILERKLPEILKDEVIRFVPAIAFRILIWAVYHEGILGLTRYYSLDFLKHSHFTSQGVIDDKKAAEDMIMDMNLSVQQRYKLACIYCFPRYIYSFFNQIVRDRTNAVFGPEYSKWMEKPEIVEYWTCHLNNEPTPRNISVFEKSFNSGSKESVKYFLDRVYLTFREKSLIFVATQVLDKINERNDWIVFRDEKFDDSKESWVPNYFYVDILCFCISNMTETQQQNAFKKNILTSGVYTNGKNQITVLELFLFWPYQDYFMKTIALLWDFMPMKRYAVILLKICDKIEPCEKKELVFEEEKSYDYRKLLIDFWSQSPNRFKRYVFADRSTICSNGKVARTSMGLGLLFKLISLKKFTYEDLEIVGIILGSATSEEKAYLTSGRWWASTCINILGKEKFEVFGRLLKVICKSEEEIRQFKAELDIFEVSRTVCRYFLSYGKMNAVKSLIKCMSFTEHQLYTLKDNVIFSEEAINHCRKLLSSKRYTNFEEFIKWFLPSKERAIKFKKHLASNLHEDFPVYSFTSVDALNFISSFTRSKLPNVQAVQGIQTSIADIFGRTVCEDLIAGSSFLVVYDEKDSSVHVKTEFRGGQWERVDEFLSWSLRTEKKVLEFKKSFLEQAGDIIHYNLIKAKQWKEAKRFFDWLELTVGEIKNLKESALFERDCWVLLHHLVFDHDDEMNNLEDLDLLLRWHLTDKETVIKFRGYFLEKHEAWDEAGLKKFNMLIENYLDDMTQEDLYQTCGNAEERFFRIVDGGCFKRKFSAFIEQKKFRLSSHGEEVVEVVEVVEV